MNNIILLPIPSEEKVKKDHILSLHNDIRDYMIDVLINSDIQKYTSSTDFIPYTLFNDINKIRILLWDIVYKGINHYHNLDHVYAEFTRYIELIRYSTNKGLVLEMQRFLDIWNRFVDSCKNDDILI
jgi:hypothetical protein